jgi:hypothetical protein
MVANMIVLASLDRLALSGCRRPSSAPGWHLSKKKVLIRFVRLKNVSSIPAKCGLCGAIAIAWSKVVLQDKTIAGTVLVPFFTEGYEGFDVNNPYDWTLAEHLVTNGKAQLPVIPQGPYPLKERS